jgi:hypothetical protein
LQFDPGVTLKKKRDFSWLETQLLSVRSLRVNLKIIISSEMMSFSTLFIICSSSWRPDQQETQLKKITDHAANIPTHTMNYVYRNWLVTRKNVSLGLGWGGYVANTYSRFNSETHCNANIRNQLANVFIKNKYKTLVQGPHAIDFYNQLISVILLKIIIKYNF